MSVRLHKAQLLDSNEWVEGYLSKCEGEFVIVDNEGIGKFIKPDTICGETGTTDFKDNKIWENDIIRIHDMTSEDYIVGWSDDMTAFQLCDIIKNIGTGDLLGEVVNGGVLVEVIGNIFDTELEKIQYPLIGIICNWKGLKEENYLYTVEEMERFDKELLNACIQEPEHVHESGLIQCAWKTWNGFLIRNECQLREFLEGKRNEMPVSSESEQFEELGLEWYWENITNNDIYNEYSETMKKALQALEIENDSINRFSSIAG